MQMIQFICYKKKDGNEIDVSIDIIAHQKCKNSHLVIFYICDWLPTNGNEFYWQMHFSFFT